MKRVAFAFLAVCLWVGSASAAEMYLSEKGLGQWIMWSGITGAGAWCSDGRCVRGFGNSTEAASIRNSDCAAKGLGDYDTDNRHSGTMLSCYECGSDAWVENQRYFFCWNDPSTGPVFVAEPEEPIEVDTYWLGVFVYCALGVCLALVFVYSVWTGARV